MPRPAIKPEQRVIDLFLEMSLEDQKELLDTLADIHRFCVKRDSRVSGGTKAEKPYLEPRHILDNREG